MVFLCKQKKAWIILLVILVATIMFAAGCTTSSTKEEATKGTATGETKGGTTVAPTLGLPIVKEKVTLKFMRFQHPANKPLNEMPMFIKLEEATNVHIDWDDVPYTAWKERLGLALASGDLPDAIFGGGVTDYEVLSNKERFMLLDDLIAKYAPNITMMLKYILYLCYMNLFLLLYYLHLELTKSGLTG